MLPHFFLRVATSWPLKAGLFLFRYIPTPLTNFNLFISWSYLTLYLFLIRKTEYVEVSGGESDEDVKAPEEDKAEEEIQEENKPKEETA